MKKQTKKKKESVKLPRGYIKKNKTKRVPSVYNRHLKPKDSSFKATTVNFLYGVFRSLIVLNSLSSDNGGEGLVSGTVDIKNLSLFSIKSKASRFTILRAPYRYKKGRYQIGFRRYKILSTFNIELPMVTKSKDNSFFWISNFFDCTAKSLSNASSNVVNLNKIRLMCSVRGGPFFNISSYKPKSD